jgi:Bax protein
VTAPATPDLAMVHRLLTRVDVVPPSLALAQAAIETGWGTSRRARVNHNLFGLTVSSDDGREATLTSFPTLIAAVRFYVHTLNTHPAYATFRRIRAADRAVDRQPDGERLAVALRAYSEIGKSYVHDIRRLIRQNDLSRFENAQLSAPVETASGQI